MFLISILGGEGTLIEAGSRKKERTLQKLFDGLRA